MDDMSLIILLVGVIVIIAIVCIWNSTSEDINPDEDRETPILPDGEIVDDGEIPVVDDVAMSDGESADVETPV